MMPPEGSGFLIADGVLQGNWSALQGAIRHLVLPACTLGLLVERRVHQCLAAQPQPQSSFGLCGGCAQPRLSETQVILRHALPNALLPVLTIAGITVASLIGGALLIEVTFSWPGIALRLQESINQRDYPVVQGIVVVVAALSGPGWRGSGSAGRSARSTRALLSNILSRPSQRRLHTISWHSISGLSSAVQRHSDCAIV